MKKNYIEILKQAIIDVCNLFQESLSRFFDGTDSLADIEKDMLAEFSKLTKEQQNALISFKKTLHK